MRIRPFDNSESEYAAITAVQNAAHPDQLLSAAGLQHTDQQRSAFFFFERYVAIVDEQIVAHGEIGHTEWSYRPNKYRITWDCHPDWCNSAEIPFLDNLYQRLLERTPSRIQVYIREDNLHSIRHLKQLGFELGMRDIYSELPVASFDVTAHAGLTAKLAASGVRILTLGELCSQPTKEWMPKLKEAAWDMLQDMPHDEPFTKSTVEEWWKETSVPDQPHDAYFIAVTDAGDYVGISNLKTGVGKIVQTGFTGVKRGWRRKGIATALKMRAVAFAHDYGATTIQTDNEESNPMYQLNVRLGFEPRTTWCNYIKTFPQDKGA
ncbi:MAG: GNAT family N-acetyltransferase [Candidatus Promineifilaceae bacterium]